MLETFLKNAFLVIAETATAFGLIYLWAKLTKRI